MLTLQPKVDKTTDTMNALETVERLKQRFPNEPEYIQAVSQVLGTIEEEYNRHPEFDRAYRASLHTRSYHFVPCDVG